MTTRPKGSSINYQDITNIVSLKDLGAVGDDITTKLVAALTAGNAVIVPPGTWLIGSMTLPANSVLIGTGHDCILKVKDANNGVAITISSNNYLSNFAIDGNKSNQVGSGLHGINISGATRSKLENIKIINTKGNAINIANSAGDINIDSVTITGYTESGIRVLSGNDIAIVHPYIYTSDPAATGDGISILSDGGVITNMVIDCPMVEGVSNRSLALIGSGSKNVSDVIINAPRITGSSSHGIFMLLVDSISILGGTVKTCGGDGVRLEGDTQNCAIAYLTSRGNSGVGVREVVNGSTPNNNKLTYNQAAGNTGGNTVTKVGAQSVVV